MGSGRLELRSGGVARTNNLGLGYTLRVISGGMGLQYFSYPPSRFPGRDPNRLE
jgi:hypothetical protein